MIGNERVFAPIAKEQKTAGAYYTKDAVADFLSKWALQGGAQSVLDPCFGGGVFLERLLAARSSSSVEVHGVELNSRSYDHVQQQLDGQASLHKADFFVFAKRALQKFGAIVGNPPFIRYHRFSGTDRDRALNAAARAGVALSKLASSWAYFVVVAASLLRDGGRLAFVVPAELQYSTYSRAVLRYLHAHFAKVTVIYSEERFFPDLAEDTLLLLCDGYGEDRKANFSVTRISAISELATLDVSVAAQRVTSDTAIVQGLERLSESLLAPAVRTLYRQLRAAPTFARLRTLADVGIGYVTGNNKFFHVSNSEAFDLGITHAYLQPTLYRGKAFAGVAFHVEDWLRACEIGDAGYLIDIPPGAPLDMDMRRYIEHGERIGVPDAYKCQVRQCWYSVPHVYRPDAFLTSMSGAFPRMVLNEVNVVATNSVHIVRLHEQSAVTARELCVRWLSTATQLSAEIEGHALGGGMLKLEPTEAENVLVPTGIVEWDEQLLHRCDDDIREGNLARATARVDESYTASAGLSATDVKVLRQGLSDIRNRRAKQKCKI